MNIEEGKNEQDASLEVIALRGQLKEANKQIKEAENQLINRQAEIDELKNALQREREKWLQESHIRKRKMQQLKEHHIIRTGRRFWQPRNENGTFKKFELIGEEDLLENDFDD